MKSIPSSSDRLDFETHLKYIGLLAKLGNGLSVSYTTVPAVDAAGLAQIKDKTRLIELTHKSVMDEYEIVKIDEMYSTAAVLWLPIKSYYLTYHLLCVIDYLITGKSAVLRARHSDCVERFTGLLADGSLQFNEPLLNKVCDRSILTFNEARGEHLKRNVADETLYKLVMKKVATDKLQGLMQSRGIANARGKENQKQIEKLKQNLTVSVFDFFYQMRLRLNYRNFDFIDHVSARQTAQYFGQYFTAAGQFYDGFSNLKNKMVADVSVGASAP